MSPRRGKLAVMLFRGTSVLFLKLAVIMSRPRRLWCRGWRMAATMLLTSSLPGFEGTKRPVWLALLQAAELGPLLEQFDVTEA